MKAYITACPRNCYSTCSMKVWVKDNRIVRIDPNPDNRATPEGPCLKGLSYIERAHSKDRILHPLKKQDGEFVPISWEEAFNTITQKLQFYKNEYGCNSVLFYAASGMSGLLNSVSSNFWRLYGGATTVYGNLCWPAGLEATRLTLGAIKHNVPWDLENAKLIILWGKNPAETNIQQMIPIEKAQAKGAKLVVIDPRRTPSAEQADVHLQPKPGTDGILALAVAKIIVSYNRIDLGFIQKYVKGFTEFESNLDTFKVEDASKECGIPPDMIMNLAVMIWQAETMTIVPGYGMQRFTNGGQTMRCLLALQVITGNIGKPGACWHYADLQGDIFSNPKEPENYYPDPNDKGVFRRTISTARLGKEMLSTKNPELKMAWVERGNPITQNPDSNRVREAFRKLDFRVVVDQFMTDTAMEADIVLPAKNMFEQSDIVTSYWHPYIQYKPKILEPAGEVKPETELCRELALRLGFDEKDIAENFPGSSNQEIETWLDKQLEEYPTLSLYKLKEGPQLSPVLQEIAFEDLKFPTPSGKIELYSEQARQLWEVDALPSFVSPTESLPRSSTHTRRKVELEVEFPFHLLTPNTKNRIHSQFGNLEVIKAVTDEPYAQINLGDASKKGIKDGDRIRVFNARGVLILKTKVDASMRPGCISIANGFWHQEEACPNSLSLGRETDMGHGAAFHDNMVNYGLMKD